MRERVLTLAAAASALLIFGCVTAHYTGPAQPGLTPEQTTRYFDTDQAKVMQAISTHGSTLFFSIDQIDQDAGTVSANFSGDPFLYVDGGQYSPSGGGDPQPYSAYLRKRNLKMNASIALAVARVADGRTAVTVNAHYTVTLPGKDFMNSFTGEVQKGDPTIWTFDSLSNDTQVASGSREGTGDASRTFAATGTLEKEVLDEIASILR